MSAPVVVWLVVGLVSLMAVAAVLVGLVRHVLLLARTLGRFQEEVSPLAQEIAAESDRATSRTSAIPGDLPFGRR